MDFTKENLGVEVQFGKYAFMVYNVCAKMTIFKNLGHIDSGVEIVPTKNVPNGCQVEFPILSKSSGIWSIGELQI